MRTFSVMNSYLITEYFILASKTGAVSPQNDTQRNKRHARVMKKKGTTQ